MKLLKLNQRAVKAYGIDWLVRDADSYITINRLGFVHSYYFAPLQSEDVNLWLAEEGDERLWLGTIDLEGADWTTTLTYIGKDKHNALLSDNEMGFNHD